MALEASERARCAIHGLSYDAQGPFGCPLCRQHNVRAGHALERSHAPRLSLWLVLALCGACLFWLGSERIVRLLSSLFPAPGAPASQVMALRPAARGVSVPSPGAAEGDDGAERAPSVRCGAGSVRGSMHSACSGALGASSNRPQRAGEYFLPERRSGRRLPVLIYLHGERESPASVLTRLSPAAESERFVLIAPEANASSWRIPDAPERTTADALHVLACLLEVQALPALAMDNERVLVAGSGSGAAEAAYLATNHSEFSAFAVLGGALVPSSLGPLRVPAWLSTLEQDPSTPPKRLLADAALLGARGFEKVERAVVDTREAPAGEQLRLLVRWWLDVPE